LFNLIRYNEDIMKAVTLFAILLFFLSAPATLAQGFNAGIVQGLWYSQEKIFVGETVRIYVAIRNNTGSDLTGTVEFFDGERRIDRQNVQALSGRIVESWADWKPSYGSHDLSATLSRIEIHTIGSSTKSVEVTSAIAKDALFVDYDTDGDGIGNEEDSDDDGDGVSDVQEKINGTDPLVKNVVEKEESATAESKDNDTTDETIADNTEIDRENGPEGLEQYLAESPAENVFSTVTRYINAAKQNLDTYRENREVRRDTHASSTLSTVNADGFGEISRGQEGEQVTEKSDEAGFFDKLFGLIGTLLNAIYTFILATLSFILAHPILVQLGILLIILFAIVKLAAKFGKRRSKY
jgi:hypothetical protein